MSLDSAFTFERWQNWLIHKARDLQGDGIWTDCKWGGEPTPKPCCSFRLWTSVAMGQFNVWATGEIDYDVMDAHSKELTHHRWGVCVDDFTFEAKFQEFRSCVADFRP